LRRPARRIFIGILTNNAGESREAALVRLLAAAICCIAQDSGKLPQWKNSVDPGYLGKAGAE
jgi:hypothetical protein